MKQVIRADQSRKDLIACIEAINPLSDPVVRETQVGIAIAAGLLFLGDAIREAGWKGDQ